MEYKDAGVALVSAESGESNAGWKFSGYASTFHNVDAVGDRVLPGAFAETIKGRNVPILWSHDPMEPIGKTTTMREDDKGLWFKAELVPTRRSEDVKELVKGKVVTGVSIGYNPVRKSYKGDVRQLEAIDLVELSICLFPANSEARLATSGDWRIIDELTCAEVENLLSEGKYVPPWQWVKYWDATKRQIERTQYGLTLTELVRQLSAELRELAR